MTSVDQLLETALFGKLAGYAPLISELGGTLIFNQLAPPDTALPYVIFQYQGGGDENLISRRMINTPYTVKAVAASKAKAHSINEDIDAALHMQTLTVSGYTNFWTAREDRVSYHELESDGAPVFHEGGVYRIRLGQ